MTIDLLEVNDFNAEMVRGFINEYNMKSAVKTDDTIIFELTALSEIDNGVSNPLGFLYGEFVEVDTTGIYTFNIYGFYIKPEFRRVGYAKKMIDLLLGYMNYDSVIKPHDVKIHVRNNALDMKILMYRYGFNHIDNNENHIIFSYCRLRDILRYSLDVLSDISDLSGIYKRRRESHLLNRELGVSIVGDEFAIGTVVSGKQVTLLSTNDISVSHVDSVVDFLNQAMIDRLKNYITGI